MPTRQLNEDLFEDTRMSFGEHLEELRKVLIRSLYGIGIGCVFGFLLAPQVVQIIKRPLSRAIADFKLGQATDAMVERSGWLSPEVQPWLEQERKLPETVLVDPGQLRRAQSSNFMEGVDLNPYGFDASHFDAGKLTQLCSRLAGSDDADVIVGRRLHVVWSLLNSSEKQVVERLAGQSTQPTAADLEAIVAIFNRIARLRELNKAVEFEGVFQQEQSSFWSFFLAEQTNWLAKMKEQLDADFDENLNLRLNRVLITRLFPDEMLPVRLNLVPIEIWRDVDDQPQSLGATEPFMIWLKAGIISGLFFASPWVFYQLWSFVAAGLYPHEQRYIYVFLPISLALFFSGALLAFFFVFEPVLAFLFSFNAQLGISPEPRINEWLSFVLFLPLGFGIAFQLPLVMLLLNRIGVFSIDDYLTKWRVAVMIIFVLSMLLTPADPISMVMLAIPLTGLYFLGIALCKWLPSRRNPFDELPRTASSSA